MKQYRIIKKYYNDSDRVHYYDIEYSYPFLPFWMFLGTRSTLERAKEKLEWEKNKKLPPNPEVVYRE